ncbi:MAG TPA: MFS transporter [Stellaceae bacterium]|jgi:MFS family permease|nr:MFS transporter [Stellaceae bacterium]
MLSWLRELNAKERQTMGACFGGWALDAFDVQMYSFIIPTIIGLWGLSRGEAGLIGTVTLLISSLGGWFSGTLADRYGRVKMLQITVLWYSIFTFLCAFAQNFEQLFILRALHGFGFGGEWAAGAVLMGEVIRDKYRGRAVGLVQTGWAVGWGASALAYTALYWFLPEWLAWRVLFGIGLIPAVFVIWIRRHIEEADIYQATRSEKAPVGVSHLFAAFRGPHLWTTVKVTLMVAGAQGGGYSIGIWMPTYLRTVRNLSSTSTGGFLLVQILGALAGFLIGSYLSDGIGRKWTFFWSAVGSFVMVLLFLLLPLNNTALFWLGIPLNVILLMKFPPMGPFMTELFPTEVRGTAQGFCYNAARALGSFFPTLVGFLSQVMPLGVSIAVCSATAFGIMILMLLLLPETRGRTLASLEPRAATGE